MQIQILNVSILTVPTQKGSYQKADVAYKNLSFQGKVEGKNVMSFGATKNAFTVLSTAQPGDIFDVEVVKNQAGYNDWVSLAKATAAAMPTPQLLPASKSNPAPKSNYETAEERAERQTSIIRQSSLGHAVATLSVGSKKVTPEEVIAVAKQYEAFVKGKEAPVINGGATGFDDVPTFDETFEVN